MISAGCVVSDCALRGGLKIVYTETWTIKILLLIVLLILYFLPPVGAGFVLFFYQGAYIAIALVSFIIFLILVLGDRLILAMAQAQQVPLNWEFSEMIKNFSCRLGLSNVDVYFSKKFATNIYIVDSVWRKPVLIIGPGVLEKLGPEEFRQVVFAALFRIKLGDARFRTFYSLALSFLFFPLFILGKSDNFFIKFIRNLIEFFLFPLNLLRVVLSMRKAEITRFDNQMIKLFGCKEELASGYFKISLIERPFDGRPSSRVMENLAQSTNTRDDVLENFIKFGFSAKERYQEIMSKNC